MPAPRVPRFDEHSEPTTVRVTRFIDVLLWILSTPGILTLIALVADVIVAIAITRPIRHGRGIWFALALIAVYWVIRNLIALPLQKWVGPSEWYATLAEGKLRFKRLKGIRNQTFKFLLRCDKCVDLIFKEEAEEEVINKIGARDLAVTEKVYFNLYRDADYPPSEWPEAWEQIKNAEFAGVKFGETIRSGRRIIFQLKGTVISGLASPFLLIYAAGTFWLSADVAGGRNPLRLAQFALLLGFVMALIIFINFTAMLRVIGIVSDDDSFKVQTRHDSLDINVKARARQLEQAKALAKESELTPEIAAHSGEVYYPAVIIRSGYIESIRNAFTRGFFVDGILVAVALELLILIQWPFALASSHWSSSQVDTWTMKMLVATASMPLAFLVALMLGFTVLARFQQFIGVLVSGLIMAAIPPLITYIVRGSPGTAVVVTSLITGAIGAVSTAIAEAIKERPSSNARAAEGV